MAKKQQELRTELSSIRQQQQGHKSSRGNIQEKISNLDAQLKSRINEQKNARSKVQFKNVEEVDQQIARLEKQVDTGTMKLVDEKKALSEISNLRKQRKGFAGFEEQQKGIDNVKAQIAEIKKGLDNPEQKALSEKYTAIQKELDEIKAEQDSAFKDLNKLRDERTKLHADQQEKWQAMRTVKDNYFSSRRAYKEYEDELYKQRKEKQRSERDAFEKDKRKKAAAQRLEEASEPAFMDEIITAEGLIRYFDPSFAPSTKQATESKFAAPAQRKVEDSDIKGTRVVKKTEEEENYFMGTGGKKGKKGRKANNASPAPSTPTEGKFNINIGTLGEFNKINVEPPMNQSQVPDVVEKLKAKVSQWKSDQDKVTKEVR